MTPTLSKSEYKVLQLRYLGPDWDGSEGEISASDVATRMGVPVAEVLSDLDQLRAQQQSNVDSLAWRKEVLAHTPMRGWKGVVTYVVMVGGCILVMVLLILSLNWFVPKGDVIWDRPGSEGSTKPDIMVQPQ